MDLQTWILPLLLGVFGGIIPPAVVFGLRWLRPGAAGLTALAKTTPTGVDDAAAAAISKGIDAGLLSAAADVMRSRGFPAEATRLRDESKKIREGKSNGR